MRYKNSTFFYIKNLSFCDIEKLSFCNITKLSFCDIKKVFSCDFKMFGFVGMGWEPSNLAPYFLHLRKEE